jgi:hypothetical protein
MFRVIAYLAPLAVGFGVGAALALTEGSPPRRRLLAGAGVLGAAVAPLGMAAFGESFAAFVKVSILLASFAAFVAGLYLVAEACRLPREISQVLSGFVLAALVGSVFWAGPLIREAADSDPGGKGTYGRISLAVAVSPYMVMGYSVFGVEPLHGDALRPLGLHDYQFGRPGWGSTSAGYALAALLLFGAAGGLAALRKGRGGVTAPPSSRPS